MIVISTAFIMLSAGVNCAQAKRNVMAMYTPKNTPPRVNASFVFTARAPSAFCSL